jgi:esterase/lipase superfamily enzyme
MGMGPLNILGTVAMDLGLRRPSYPRLRVLVTLVLGLGLSGCVSASFNDFTASTVAASGLFPAAPASGPVLVPLFVASTRPSEHAQADRSNVVQPLPTYSLATVSVPAGHVAGSIERPGWRAEDRKRHFVLAGRRALDESAFRNEIAAHISGRVGANRDILVFVHGFNVNLDEARFRLAQIVADGQFGGVPVLFTWPSGGNAFAYSSDKERATASRDALEALLQELAATPGVGRVHILAHSMGTWLAMEALRQGAIAGHADLSGHLGEIMLAAPDIDLAVFEGQMARIGPSAHVSVFVSADDRALSLSSALAGARPRLGGLDLRQPEAREEITRLGVQVFDLTGKPDPDFFHHGAYANAPQVIAAIGAQLAEPRPQDQDVTDTIGQPVNGSAPPARAVAVSDLPPLRREDPRR